MNNYEIITNAIIEKLDEGVIPWRRPYQGKMRWQKNFKTGQIYNGTNQMMTQMQNKLSPFWLTFKQASTLGGKIKKGSKGVPILWASMVEYEDTKGEMHLTSIHKRTYVFNIEDVEGLDYEDDDHGIVELDFNPIEECEKILEISKDRRAEIQNHTERVAAYYPSFDVIKTPIKETYVSEEEYYNTIFHEIIHSTGHSTRIGRNMTAKFHTPEYAKEELTAEIGAAMISGIAGIADRTLDNSAAYISEWKKCIKAHPKIIVMASSRAQKAIEYLKLK